MAIWTATVKIEDTETEGGILIDSVTGLPLPLSVQTFEDAEAANNFLDWYQVHGSGVELRRLSTDELEKAVGVYGMWLKG